MSSRAAALFLVLAQVSDLRAELDRRSLSTAGLKADLLARLSDALEEEEEDRAAREEEEKAKAATEAGGGDDEFEDCLPDDVDDGDGEDQSSSGSVARSKPASTVSVDTAEANLVATQAAASAAAQATATWISTKSGSTSSGSLRSTAGTSPSSSVVGHAFPWLLRGGFACRALLHLATSEAAGEEGHPSGGASAAVAGTLAADARAAVGRFEACVDALSTASTVMNSSSNSIGDASGEASREVTHLQAPSNLQAACSFDRLEGAVLALERFLSVHWPNGTSSSASSSATAPSAHAAAPCVPALQGLLQLHLLLDRTLATALTAAAAAGSTADGTAMDSTRSSGLSTSTLSNACSFLEDCASMVSLFLFYFFVFWVACSRLVHFERKKRRERFCLVRA